MSLQKRLILSLSGHSGVGKSHVIATLKQDYDFVFAVSTTTREPRVGEQDGVEYYFVSKEKFSNMIANQDFIEHTKFLDNYYGTSRAELDRLQNKNVIMDLTLTKETKQNLPNVIWCVLVHDSNQVLRERLEQRAKENHTDTNLIKRIEHLENQKLNEQDYDIVINVTDKTAQEICIELMEKVKSD